MRQRWWARPARHLVVAAATTAVLATTATTLARIPGRPITDPLPVALLCAVLAALASALSAALPRLDAMTARVTGHRPATPYAALAAAAARIRAGSLEQALPGLARVLAEGTAATGARVWLAVGEQLVAAAQYPAAQYPATQYPATTDRFDRPRRRVTASSVTELLTRPDASIVVPVVDGPALRAALTIDKRHDPITPADRALLGDVAHGAALLLRTVAANAEVAARLARAEALAGELQASRQRLTRARDLARRRLVAELGHATTDPLRVLRTEITAAHTALTEASTVDPAAQPVGDPADVAAPAACVQRARAALDELLTRFRVIARGVYPAALRDHGPAAALADLAADLTRPVEFTGTLGPRLAHEIESGLYYAAAAAMTLLDGDADAPPLSVELRRAAGALTVTITDPTPPLTVDGLRRGLSDDRERLAALGGDVNYGDVDCSVAGPPTEPAASTNCDLTARSDDPAPAPVTLHAWLPDRLDPPVDPIPAQRAATRPAPTDTPTTPNAAATPTGVS